MEQEGLWVAQAMRGDQGAFARLVDAYKTPIYNLCYRMLGNVAEAEDAAQETFVRIYTHLQGYDPQQRFSSWALAVASHYCVDRLRRRRIPMLSLDEDPSREPISIDTVHPEEMTMKRESSLEIRRWLQALSPEYRLVITLRYWQDLSYEEIARITGTTEGAIKSRLHRARAMIAQQVLAQRNRETRLDCAVHEGKKVVNHATL